MPHTCGSSSEVQTAARIRRVALPEGVSRPRAGYLPPGRPPAGLASRTVELPQTTSRRVASRTGQPRRRATSPEGLPPQRGYLPEGLPPAGFASQGYFPARSAPRRGYLPEGSPPRVTSRSGAHLGGATSWKATSRKGLPPAGLLPGAERTSRRATPREGPPPAGTASRKRLTAGRAATFLHP
jgi:hypothetical protein